MIRKYIQFSLLLLYVKFISVKTLVQFFYEGSNEINLTFIFKTKINSSLTHPTFKSVRATPVKLI